MSTADPTEIALRIAGILVRSGVRYLVGGSLASTAFGEPRATLDVDLVIDLRPEQVDAFVAAVEGDFFVDRSWVHDEVRRHGSFQLVHRASMIRVDVFVPEWTGLHLWKWQRRRAIDLGGPDRVLDVTAPEGIVIQKLVWYREGGATSDRQWRDVLGVLKSQRGNLDLGETRDYAARCGVSELFERACAEAGVA